METGEPGVRELLERVLRAMGRDRLLRGLRDPVFRVCLAAAVIGLPLHGGAVTRPLWFLMAPFMEELTWRCLIQEELESARERGRRGVTQANILVSFVFALAHVVASPSLLAVLTFFPSLLLGLVWTRTRSLLLCAVLHLAYNTAFVL